MAASQCSRGATFSEAVVSPAVDGSGIMHVPGVSSLAQCVASGCELPGSDLAWLFQGRCYVLSCQQREHCQPRERPGADSVLAFLRRTPSQMLVLQSLVRGGPYGARWGKGRSSSSSSEDLQALKDLALFDASRQDFSQPGAPGLEYSEGSQEERGEERGEEGGEEVTYQPMGGDGGNQSEAGDGPGRRLEETSTAQIRDSSRGSEAEQEVREPRAANEVLDLEPDLAAF